MDVSLTALLVVAAIAFVALRMLRDVDEEHVTAAPAVRPSAYG